MKKEIELNALKDEEISQVIGGSMTDDDRSPLSIESKCGQNEAPTVVRDTTNSAQVIPKKPECEGPSAGAAAIRDMYLQNVK